MINIPQDTLNNWLKELKPYQQKIINQLLTNNNNNIELVTEIYLMANGVSNTIPFGGNEKINKTFFNNFKAEMRKFICGDPKYASHHQKINKFIEPTKTKNTVVTIISTAIHGELGVSAALIYPAIVLFLSSVAAIGINAYCDLNNNPLSKNNDL